MGSLEHFSGNITWPCSRIFPSLYSLASHNLSLRSVRFMSRNIFSLSDLKLRLFMSLSGGTIGSHSRFWGLSSSSSSSGAPVTSFSVPKVSSGPSVGSS